MKKKNIIIPIITTLLLLTTTVRAENTKLYIQIKDSLGNYISHYRPIKYSKDKYSLINYQKVSTDDVYLDSEPCSEFTVEIENGWATDLTFSEYNRSLYVERGVYRGRLLALPFKW